MFANNEYQNELTAIINEGKIHHEDAMYHIEQSLNYLSISHTKQKDIYDILNNVFYLEAL